MISVLVNRGSAPARSLMVAADLIAVDREKEQKARLGRKLAANGWAACT